MFDLLYYSEICFVTRFLGVAEVGAWSTMFKLVVNIIKKRGRNLRVLDVFTQNFDLSSSQMRSREPKSEISSYRTNSPPTDAAA